MRLNLLELLLYYDTILIGIYIDESTGIKYILILCSEEKDKSLWISLEVDDLDIERYKSGEIDLLNLYKISKSWKLISSSDNYEMTVEYSYSSFNEIPYEYLPEENAYLTF